MHTCCSPCLALTGLSGDIISAALVLPSPSPEKSWQKAYLGGKKTLQLSCAVSATVNDSGKHLWNYNNQRFISSYLRSVGF